MEYAEVKSQTEKDLEKMQEALTQAKENLRITFTIDAPEEIEASDFNSLVLRMLRLSDTIHVLRDKADIENYNRNIKEMQNLLENFKIKTFKEV